MRSSEHHHGHQVRLGPLSRLVSPDHPVEGRVPPGVMALYMWNYKGFEGSFRNVSPNLAILSGVMRKFDLLGDKDRIKRKKKMENSKYRDDVGPHYFISFPRVKDSDLS